jgi:hypothetical protein
MRHSLHSPRALVFLVSVCALALTAGPRARDSKPDKTKPSLDVKSSPSMGFAPFRTVLTVEVKGGPDDYEQYYCASVEWDLGDGTVAEQKIDCDPYEAGKSQIKRRYVREQVFNSPGEFRVLFRLKQNSKVVGTGQTTVRVRPGIRDDGGTDR